MWALAEELKSGFWFWVLGFELKEEGCFKTVLGFGLGDTTAVLGFEFWVLSYG